MDERVKLTREEHVARAMLMGMSYHDGNGNAPFYYGHDEHGLPDRTTFVDAVTLEPLVPVKIYDDHFKACVALERDWLNAIPPKYRWRK